MSIRFLCRGFAEDNLITHFIGEDEVKALATDLGARLKKLEGNYPLTWFALGKTAEGGRFPLTIEQQLSGASHGTIRDKASAQH